ncbi:acyl-CoA synthetase [Amphritea sp. HPY]|uniref:acyl-CoA synthetase n=1 Tax=Amphritea sp. HPY TaxID=3421652 RepID=UPI003D7CC80C
MKKLGFWNFAQENPQHLALVAPDGREWSRGELLEECNKIVHGLRQLGLEKGDTVAAMLPNCAEYIALHLAVTQAGFFLVPINWHLAGPEVAYILQDSGAKAFFCHELTTKASKAALDEVSFDAQAAFMIGSSSELRPYAELIAGQPGTMPEDRATGMVMFYTSGTTGKPKGVRRAVPKVDPDTTATNFTMFPALFGIEAGNDNVHFCGSPLYHTAVMNWSTNSLHLGHAVVVHEKWEGEAMLQAIEQYRITTAHVVPTQLVRLLKLTEEVRNRYDVSSMRHMMHTAAPCSPDVKRAIIEWFGPCVYEYYAATEGGGAICNSEEWLANPGTVGKAWYGADIKIFDEEGAEVPTGEKGTVYMLMPEISRFEYKGDKAKTEKDRRGDYFTAGDVGYLNEGGYLFLCDRKIDMIISGGANIYPAEIENVLILHPEIQDCCVFGIPNADWGEEIKAVVQPVDGVDADDDFTENVMAFLGERLAKMKWPKSIDYMPQLPRDPNGKLYKRRLRAPYWEGQEVKV